MFIVSPCFTFLLYLVFTFTIPTRSPSPPPNSKTTCCAGVGEKAMGIYLYGELIISRCRKQRAVAESCFKLVRHDMEEGTERAVHLMVYGQALSTSWSTAKNCPPHDLRPRAVHLMIYDQELSTI